MASSNSNAVAQIQTHMSFNEVQSGLCDKDLVFRLIHFWEARNPTKGGLLIGLELLFIDEQGTAIQGFISPNRIFRYEPLLKRNSIYRLTNFYATDNKRIFRVTDHKFTLCFTDLTALTELQQTPYSIDSQRFRFQSFLELEAKADRRGDLYDIIGHLKLINGQNLHQPPVLNNNPENCKGQKDRVSLHLQLREGPIVNVYLWDNAASEFIMKFQAIPTTPTVLLVTTVNPKRIGAGVSFTSMSPSRVFLDSEVVPTREYLTWLGDSATSLVSINTSQVTKVETLTIAEILQFLKHEPSQVATFHCVATIADVLGDSGWYYISCTGCNKKAIRGATSLVCNICKNQNAIGVVKYRVEISAHDYNDTATFVLLDDAVTKLFGRSSTDIVDNSHQGNGDMGPGNEYTVPQCLLDSIGHTHKFEVKVTPYDFRATRKTLSIMKVVEETEQPTNQGIFKEKADEDMPATDPAITVEGKTYVPNMKPTTAAEQSSATGLEEIMNVTSEATKLTKNTNNAAVDAGVTKPKRPRRNP